tara:strand:+ start:1194 stop:1793 length:600 start_codon:yes stop_codon:yes gene_type:complete
MIIGILGNKDHGKDTVSDYLVNKYKFEKKAFAEPLKEVCQILFGFTFEQLYGNSKEIPDKYWGVTPRNVLQFVGTELFRNKMSEIIPGISQNFWLECMRRKSIEYDRLVISDVRFQNEVDFIHEMNGIVIKIERRDKETKDAHASEKELKHITNYDLYIANNSDLKTLYFKVDEIIKQFGIQQKKIVNKNIFDTYILGC